MSVPDPTSGAPVWDRAADARIHAAGLVALIRALGEDGAGRFLQIMAAHAAAAPGAGAGDYTAERHQWLGHSTVEALGAEILAAQTAGRFGRPTPADVDAVVIDSTAPPAD